MSGHGSIKNMFIMESVFEHLQVRCAETERQETGSVLREFSLLASSPSAGIAQRVTVSCLYLFHPPWGRRFKHLLAHHLGENQEL